MGIRKGHLIPVIAGIFILGIAGFSQDVFAIITNDLSVVTPNQMASSIFPPSWQIVSATTSFSATVAAGTFTQGTVPFNIEDGIIFSTGNIASATGPNTNDGTTTDNGKGGDFDLDTHCPKSGSRDSSIMEVVFNVPSIPAGQQHFYRLDVVYASEDYNEFVFTAFGDCMGIFVNGENVALLPDFKPIATNTVNGGNPFGSASALNSELYNNNDLQDGGPFFDTEYDGFTDPIESLISLTGPGPHTIKFVIADFADANFDSAALISSITETAFDDSDGDGIPDPFDNCPDVSNPNQEDFDNDHLGDVCDPSPTGDADGDGVPDDLDFCPTEDATGLDFDGNGCIDDSDGDGVPDAFDVCAIDPPNGPDLDGDGCTDEIMCGAGTILNDENKCVPDPAGQIMCGAGTILNDENKCVPDYANVCGPGTILNENNQCVPVPNDDTSTDKVEICHKGKNTLSISPDAVPAHLAHGDTLGPCQ